MCLAATVPPVSYRLGPKDMVRTRVTEVPDLKDIEVQVSTDGEITLPLIGRLPVAGLTMNEAETLIRKELKRYILEPIVSFSVTGYSSQPVSVLGAVRNPGVLQLQGGKTLTEILAMAGGLKDDAGHAVVVSREKSNGPIPIPGSREDNDAQRYVADIPLRELMENRNGSLDINIAANDVITILRSELIYVIGSVKKPGGYVLGDLRTMPVLQAVALAEGLTSMAAPNRARILRRQPGNPERMEIATDLKKMLSKGEAELQLESGDILVVPDSTMRKISIRTIEALVQTGSGVTIWRSARP
ncbi:polysaccharide biosynthesis/export family protein [Bryobacter aggregatus]|uniref:polysaccharide biosynthesis/export family protein n=1 Tax=Bryobacter aggregatus TaxID=360054 RepID=UPI002351E3C7|nr:polysaccharide biosynthesis/export family protein [Bryobacter aggregatus]